MISFLLTKHQDELGKAETCQDTNSLPKYHKPGPETLGKAVFSLHVRYQCSFYAFWLADQILTDCDVKIIIDWRIRLMAKDVITEHFLMFSVPRLADFWKFWVIYFFTKVLQM